MDSTSFAGRIPLATYRLQFNRTFTFAQALEITEYLRDLGVSDLYASPLFQAGPQSTHGYDVCGFGQFNPTLGTAADFDRLAERLRQLGLGLLLDMVPNHMGADLSNCWWADVLEKGRASRYAEWFDIDWRPLKSDLHDKVLLPTLEDHYGKVLEAGKLKLMAEPAGLAIAYYDRRFPLAPGSYGLILSQLLEVCRQDPQLGEMLQELKTLLESVNRWQAASPPTAEFDEIKLLFQRWLQASSPLRAALTQILARLNGQPGDAASFAQLHALLQQQHYRLAFWRVGPEEINYRRFFDITDLVSLRMELPQVFEAAHQLVFRLLQEGKITGLRVDHPDGLWDPKQYFERLQQAANGALYVVVEKILVGDEPLPLDWPVAGTTGYDFLSQLNGLFVDRAQSASFDRIYAEFVGEPQDFPALVSASKRAILRTALISELNALAHRLKAVAVATRYGQDFTFRQLHAALAETIAAFPVYRTYATEETSELSTQERDYVRRAIGAAKTAQPRLEESLFDFLQDLLLLRPPADLDAAGQALARTFVLKFQQLTGPVMAKGLEDTAFYNFNRLVSLNEVGGEPNHFGTSPEAFHQHNAARASRWPHGLLATATHDTKRGEDARARLNVLSEMPAAWRQALDRWASLNARQKTPLNGIEGPSANDEYLLYQTLVATWGPEAESAEGRPVYRERIAAYMLKAIKEAKAHTSWTNPNSAYEEATRHFVESLLLERNPFLEDLRSFVGPVAFFGRFNSLAQTLLKLTSPGVPDFYQGTELWDFSLVDPDNRRPVDYALRQRWLAELKTKAEPSGALPTLLSQLLEQAATGQIKLYLIWRGLSFRRQQRPLFEAGHYVPLPARGAKAPHVCAFARSWEGRTVLTVVPRLVFGLAGGIERPPMGPEVWEDTLLPVPETNPGQRYRNVLTQEVVSANETGGLPLASVLARFPVALLEKIG